MRSSAKPYGPRYAPPAHGEDVEGATLRVGVLYSASPRRRPRPLGYAGGGGHEKAGAPKDPGPSDQLVTARLPAPWSQASLLLQRQRVGGLRGGLLALPLERLHEVGRLPLEGQAHQPMHEHQG